MKGLYCEIDLLSEGQEGDRLKKLGKQMYQGDLLYGIRDERRRRAKESNWPVKRQNTRRKDRNSWITFSLRESNEVKKLDHRFNFMYNVIFKLLTQDWTIIIKEIIILITSILLFLEAEPL